MAGNQDQENAISNLRNYINSAYAPDVSALAQEAGQGQQQEGESDPVRAAFDAVSKGAEQVFADSLASGIEQPKALEQIQNAQPVQQARYDLAVSENPQNAFGGPELVGAQKDSGLDPDEFGRRVRLLSVMPQDYIGKLQSFRDGLKDEDKTTFDQAYFPQLQDSIDSAYQDGTSSTAKLSKGQSPFYYTNSNGHVIADPSQDPNAIAHFSPSPKAEELLTKFGEAVGVPYIGTSKTLGNFHAQLADAVAHAPEDYQGLVSEGVRKAPTDVLAGGGAFDPILKAASDYAINQLPNSPALLPTNLAVAGLSRVTGKGPSFSDMADAEKGIAHSLVDYAVDHPVQTTAVVASFWIPVIGEEAAGAMITRVAANYFIGAATSAGMDLLDGERSITKLAKDASVGGLINATLPEIGVALVKARSLDPAVIKAAVEETRLGTVETRVAADGSIVTRDGATIAANQAPDVIDGVVTDTGKTKVLNDLRPHEEAVTSAKNAVEQAKVDLTAAQERAQNQYSSFGYGAAHSADVEGATERLATARRDLRNAQRRLQRANAKAQAEQMAQRATDAGADEPITEAIRLQQEALVADAARYNDPLLSASSLRRNLSFIAGVFSGRLTGFIAHIGDQSARLRGVLNEMSRSTLDPIAERFKTAVAEHLDEAVYVGPKNRAAIVTRDSFTKVSDMIEHPEYWKGVHADIRSAINDFQKYTNQKYDLINKWAKAHKIKLSDAAENYLSHMWENDTKQVKAALRGVNKSFTKGREFTDVYSGISAGLTPRTLGVEELFAMHDAQLNDMLADVFFSDNVARMYGRAGKARLGDFTATFDSPFLRGVTADKAVVDSVDSYFSHGGAITRNLNTFTQRVKNSMFGTADLGVFGIQLLSSMMKGSVPFGVSVLNDAIRGISHGLLPHVQTEALYEANGGRTVTLIRHGLKGGRVAGNIEASEHTVASYIPQLGKLDSLFERAWVDRLTELQFQTVLTPVRQRIAEGNMIANHLLYSISGGRLGGRLDDPRTIEASTHLANSVTLTSEGAQRGMRRDAERILVTAANVSRGEMNTLKQLAGVINLTRAGSPEWNAGAMIALSFATSIYTIKVATEQLFGGSVPNPFNPLDYKTWARVDVGGKHVELIKEKDILRAVLKSYKGITEQDPNYVASAWTQLVLGKAAPPVGAAAGLAGFGYDSNGFFQAGGLGTADRFAKLIPAAPILQRLYSGQTSYHDPLGLSLESFGFNNYSLSQTEQRDKFIKTHNPYEQGDPRYALAAQHGYNGLDDSDKQQFRVDHPEFFSSENVSPELKATLDAIKDRTAKLRELESEVASDPYKRVDYRDLRQKIETDTATAASTSKREPVTIQDKAKKVYYDSIAAATKAAPAGVLTGDDFGAAVDQARAAVAAELGPEGINALDRAQSVGLTSLEAEYKRDLKAISDSGYFDLADEAIKQLQSQGEFPFTSYKEFKDEIDQYAKEKGTSPESVDAFKKVQSVISKGKQDWRAAHPQIDALLVKWGYASTARTEAARDAAGAALGRPNLPVAGAKTKKPSSIDARSLIERYLDK